MRIVMFILSSSVQISYGLWTAQIKRFIHKWIWIRNAVQTGEVKLLELKLFTAGAGSFANGTDYVGKR